MGLRRTYSSMLGPWYESKSKWTTNPEHIQSIFLDARRSAEKPQMTRSERSSLTSFVGGGGGGGRIRQILRDSGKAWPRQQPLPSASIENPSGQSEHWGQPITRAGHRRQAIFARFFDGRSTLLSSRVCRVGKRFGVMGRRIVDL